MPGYTVIVRSGARVRKDRYDNLGQALAAVEREGRELQSTASAKTIGGRLARRIEPVRQVVGRIELRGPRGLRAGVDVRGDGSAEAFTGRWQRRQVEQSGDSPFADLRRAAEADL